MIISKLRSKWALKWSTRKLPLTELAGRPAVVGDSVQHSSTGIEGICWWCEMFWPLVERTATQRHHQYYPHHRAVMERNKQHSVNQTKKILLQSFQHNRKLIQQLVITDTWTLQWLTNKKLKKKTQVLHLSSGSHKACPSHPHWW